MLAATDDTPRVMQPSQSTELEQPPQSAAVTRQVAVSRVISYAVALGIGLIAFFSAVTVPVLVRIVIAWIAASAAFMIRLWVVTMETTAVDTRNRAGAEDPGRNVALAIVSLASVFGFTSAVQLLGRTKEIAPHLPPAITMSLGIIGIITSWALIHTQMQLRYAHMYYYESGDEKGLLFPGAHEPSDIDFAYFAFVVGMTFQVSDVQVMTKEMRRIVLLHGLVSFAFNTAILALTINILSGLLH